MQRVRIRNAVNGCVNSDNEEESVGDVPRPRGNARDHFPAGEGLDEDEVGHYGQDIMVGGERGEPVDGEVVDPNEEDRDVDREDPDHED